jgi:murein DD-endopeptidase MepM/ murein hydrolase activator NlpD
MEKYVNNVNLANNKKVSRFSKNFFTTLIFSFWVVAIFLISFEIFRAKKSKTVPVSKNFKENISEIIIDEKDLSEVFENKHEVNLDKFIEEKVEKNTKNLIIKPLAGKIIKDFSLENLVYSKTMNDWRTHNGIDIESELGAPVKAIKDGIVEKVFQTDENGITVILSHEDGIKSIYTNLQNLDFIPPEKYVKCGDIIGGVGNSSVYECKEAPHLHFSIIRNGKFENPQNYLSFD